MKNQDTYFVDCDEWHDEDCLAGPRMLTVVFILCALSAALLCVISYACFAAEPAIRGALWLPLVLVG